MGGACGLRESRLGGFLSSFVIIIEFNLYNVGLFILCNVM